MLELKLFDLSRVINLAVTRLQHTPATLSPTQKQLHEQPLEESMAVTSFEKKRRSRAAHALFLVALMAIQVPASAEKQRPRRTRSKNRNPDQACHRDHR
jgi:hypothetical protein